MVSVFFDKLEDRIRRKLSRFPIFYGVIGGVGVVLFWRGVWHTADFVSAWIFAWRSGAPTIDLPGLVDGLLSFLVGLGLLLVTGLFVSSFIGNEVVISGLRGEKKLVEKTEVEVRTETGAIGKIQEDVNEVKSRLAEIEKKPRTR